MIFGVSKISIEPQYCQVNTDKEIIVNDCQWLWFEDLPDESFDDIDGTDYSSEDDEEDPVFELRGQDHQQDQQEVMI